MSSQLQLWAVPAVLLALGAVALSQTSREDRPANDQAEARDAAPPQEGRARPPQRSADDVLGEMLKPRRTSGERELVATEPPQTDKTTGPGSVAPGAPTLTVMREGTPIVNRVGRLTLGAEGGMSEFTFESDGRALRDPPLVVLPNLKLMLMEDMARDATREPRFRVSGMVTEYRGRNYLLVEKVYGLSQASSQIK